MKILILFLISHMSHAVVHISDQRGSDIRRFQSPTGLTEICVVPSRLSQAIYSAKDLEREKKLCDFNFYSSMNVLCPKFNSTSAATIIYSTTSPNAKQDLQNAAKCIALDRDKVTVPAIDKVAKFKQNEPLNSATGTNIVSPLAYYHISRALGLGLKVPVAVIRTMDVKSHQQVNSIFDQLSQLTKASPGTVQGWNAFSSMHKGARNNFKVYTGDRQQIFGALIKGGGTAKAYDIELQSTFSQTAFYKLHTSSNSVLTILSGADDFKKRALTLQAGDVTDIILLDTILEQSDRYSGSNIESYEMMWDGKPIRRLALQDNDAGMNSPKNTANLQRLEKIRHISPTTYKNLLALSRDINLKSFLENETLMSEKESARVVATVSKIAQKFQKDCLSGRLMVDLDVDAVLNNMATLDYSKSHCQ